MQLKGIKITDAYNFEEIKTDTVAGKWHIRFKQMPNGRIILQNSHKYADNSLFVDMEYNNRKIVDCKEFLTSDFIPENDTITSYMLYAPNIEQITDTIATISFTCCIPDSDVGYFITLNFDNTGKLSCKVTDIWEDGSFDPEKDEIDIKKIWSEYGKTINRIEYDSLSANKDGINTIYTNIPDSIAYVQEYYDNGKLAGEGWIVFFNDREDDGSDKFSIWKYYLQNGTMIEYEHSN